MNKIRVNLLREIDDSYDVVIGENLFPTIASGLRRLRLGKIAIITDTNVKKLYGTALHDLLKHNGIESILIGFPAGENHKNRRTKEKIENALLTNRIQRNGLIIALGGGVVGDLAGYIASTYLRGIPYLQIPTTLLSMIDSCIGGKTGVDTLYGKNTIGTFFQPKGVYIDTTVLKSLPKDELLNGVSEMIKHAIISDASHFIFMQDFLEKINELDPDVLAKAITWNLSIKQHVVEKDEKESSLRKILNFGHTIGHAIERACDYQIKHGQAVALGMIAETKIATELGMLNPVESERILSLLNSIGELPSIKKLTKAIIAATAADKKNVGSSVRYVLPRKIGKMELDVEVDAKIVKKVLGEFS